MSGYSLTGLCCSILYTKRKFVFLPILGIFISIVGFFYTTLVIWQEFYFNYDFTFKTLIILIILVISIAHSCLLLLINSQKILVAIILWTMIFFITIVAILLIILTVYWFEGFDEFYFRVLGSFAILDVLGTIVAPILNKFYSKDDESVRNLK